MSVPPVLLLIDERPPPPSGPSGPRWRPSRRAVEVAARLVLAGTLLAGADVAGGFGGYLASLGGLVAVCSAANRALPYGRGLKEHRQ